MTEIEALAICFRNLKGPRRKQLIETAEALKTLRDLPKYRTNANVGAAVGVSGEMVREFISLSGLPTDVQAMLDDDRLNLEHGRRLVQLASKRPTIVSDAAAAFVGLRAHDARDLTKYLIDHPQSSVEQAVTQQREQQSTIRHEYHVVVELDGAEFDHLAREAQLRGCGPSELAREALLSWLSNHE